MSQDLESREIEQDPRVAMILKNASRLVTVATRCVWSFGAADGLNDVLQSPNEPNGDWRQPVAVLHRDASMMATLRVAALLDRDPDAPPDRDPNVLSFQTFYHLLKDTAVQAALLEALEARHGIDVFDPSRADLIEEYLRVYAEIDWKVHGRLVHYRNLGIAHLSLTEMTKSITHAEQRTLIGIVSRLASPLQTLVKTDTTFHTNMADECRAQVKRVVKAS
jgi:hypothetical protein